MIFLGAGLIGATVAQGEIGGKLDMPADAVGVKPRTPSYATIS